MRKALWTALMVAWLVAGTLSPRLSLAEGSKAAAPPSMPKVGDVAPDFKLEYFDGSDLKQVSLSQYRGQKNVVLAFYIFAFTGG
jgi:hypothetical protein